MKHIIKNHKRGLSVLMMLFLLFVISGCGEQKTDMAVGDTITIEYSWWGDDSRNQYTLDAVDIFEKENPEINVKCKYGVWNGYEKRQHIYMKSQETPDVMLINYGWLDTYSSDGSGFYDLNTLSDYIDFENYTEEELAFGTKNGRLNAVPIAFNTETFYYNETLWNSYGLSIPRTWDDLFDAARIMSKDGVYPLGMTKKSLFFMLLSHYIQTTGNDPVKSDGTLNLNKEQIGDMLDFYKELLDKKVLMSVDSFNRNAFASGEVGGTLAWVSDAGGYCDPLKENGYDVKIGEYICEPGAKSLGWFVKPATMYAISNNTEHPEAAAKLLNYLLNGEEMTLRQGTEKGVPISSSAFEILKDHDVLMGYEVQADDMREKTETDCRLWLQYWNRRMCTDHLNQILIIICMIN